MSIVVRSDRAADAVARALRAQIARIDRDQAMTDIRTMDSVVALFVSQRRHEFGVRMALGARRVDVLLLAMREGVSVIVAGAIVGVAGALLGSQALSGLLFGITATRPSAAVDPARALRAE